MQRNRIKTEAASKAGRTALTTDAQTEKLAGRWTDGLPAGGMCIGGCGWLRVIQLARSRRSRAFAA
ncbi:hypothetical protein C9I57_21970 [Trinickia symbiotica]|uniref:Uncharacterized protein n=1 Tax=Trinickia symbiotica TaxID=863227 RepID=A0A2T3XQ79_9BURK|nr:hypothetical protein C9I57_21970 [Trinickia symbiotica]